MKPVRVLAWILGAAACVTVSAPRARAVDKPTSVILVDKKTHELHVAEYVEGEYKILRTFHATLGQVKGDKEEEGDLKTPEGIYTFSTYLTPPGLKAKFGDMAFYVNFPNAYDQLAGRTGRDIMLHATNEPDRLNKDFDSLGCVVVRNEEIRLIRPHISLNRTPLLIFPEATGLTEEYLHPGKHGPLRKFFETWLHAWEEKNLEAYLDSYHSDFVSAGKNKDQWRTYKASLNSVYSSIEVKPEHIRFYRHPKYSMVTFTQNYRSKRKGGGWGHRSRGTKILFVAEEAGKPKIIAETFSEAVW